MCDVHTDIMYVCLYVEVSCVMYIQTLCVCGGEMCDVHTDIMYVCMWR